MKDMIRVVINHCTFGALGMLTSCGNHTLSLKGLWRRVWGTKLFLHAT